MYTSPLATHPPPYPIGMWLIPGVSAFLGKRPREEKGEVLKREEKLAEENRNLKKRLSEARAVIITLRDAQASAQPSAKEACDMREGVQRDIRFMLADGE
jgi:hypothetical protein